MTATESDRRWLQRAIDLAKKCPPDPSAFSVGAIIVAADGVEIATGYSRETDSKIHAEESALAKAAGDPRLTGATIYSSLEPCGQRKSRPLTCTHLIIESGIRRVVYAWREPPDFVEAPCGHALLVAAGVDTMEMPQLRSAE
ncbi:MAG: deaminase [Actinomycetota bacterium]